VGAKAAEKPKISGGKRRSRNWRAHERERLARQWAEYWKRWERSTPIGRQRIPEPGAEVKFWKRQMRKALKTVMRKEGVRVR